MQRAVGKDMYPDDHFVTAGEKKFDFMAYTGLGYIANVALSLGAVYWVERTHMGQNFMKGFVEGTKKLFPKLKAATAQYLASKSFFLTGGFAVLVPMKMLEDRKVELIKKYDRDIYGDAVDSDPNIIKAHKDLEKAPSQTWSSIMLSRVTALIPFYATMTVLWSHDSPLSKATKGQVYFDKPITAVSRSIGKVVGKITNNGEAVNRIEQLEKNHNHCIKEGHVDHRDPNYSALPYYFISEAITSAIVARAVYLLTRVFGATLGTEDKKTAAIAKSAAVFPKVSESGNEKVQIQIKGMPTAQVNAVEHQAIVCKPELEAVR